MARPTRPKLPPPGTADRWILVVDGREVAPLEVAVDRRARGRGLLGRPGLDGALLLAPARSVHTVGMRFPINVALCNAGLRVEAVITMVPGRISRPRQRVRCVIEAEAGAFERWGLAPGNQLAVQVSR